MKLRKVHLSIGRHCLEVVKGSWQNVMLELQWLSSVKNSIGVEHTAGIGDLFKGLYEGLAQYCPRYSRLASEDHFLLQ